ncbi:MAG: M3 family oligoendopeptidase [Anaerolineaceae bacterium]|nr:M3 family oligoendopeptidase [Anaerolineaceae bacterium]
MFEALPKSFEAAKDWSWEQFKPYFDDLLQRDLTADTSDQWLADWSRLSELLDEVETRLVVATTQDTTDEAAEQAYNHFLDHIRPAQSSADQQLKEKLLESGLQPEGFEIPLRNLQAKAAIFREANIPLLVEVDKLGLEYDRIVGAQSVEWRGEEKTLPQAYAALEGLPRPDREALWRQISARHLQDRDALNGLWQQLLNLRRQIATNAGFDNYRSYQWKNFGRFDYTPADCETFHAAIEEVVVPAATRVYERLRQRMGTESVRPWDVQRDNVYPPAHPKLSPYETIDELESTAETIFQQVDPVLGGYFSTMRRENLLDLGNRKGKAPGGYCTRFLVSQRPFIFMNAVGSEDDVITLLHEAGHAFHGFETDALPYVQQKAYPIEFAEVASMSMELLSAPYWSKETGGYYDEGEMVQARRQHLEQNLLFWPYMSVVDAFQHWVYTHVDDAMDPANCDAKWGELWNRFIPGMDWTGLDDARMTGWHRKLHIFQLPFYYVDYGLAQLGALQVWRNALSDQQQAVANYRKALAMGGTATLPDLFATAGARFAFDAAVLRDVVGLIESTLTDLGVA